MCKHVNAVTCGKEHTQTSNNDNTSLADFSPESPTCPRHAATQGRRCMVRRSICMLPHTHTRARAHTHTHNVERSNTAVNKTSQPQTSQSKRGPIVRLHADQAMCSTTDQIVFLFSPTSTPAPSPTPLQTSI